MGVRLIRIRRLEEKNLGLEFGGGWCLSACCVYIFVLCCVVFGKDKKRERGWLEIDLGGERTNCTMKGFFQVYFAFGWECVRCWDDREMIESLCGQRQRPNLESLACWQVQNNTALLRRCRISPVYDRCFMEVLFQK